MASRSMSISGVLPTDLDDASSHNPIFSGTMDQTYTVTVMDVDGLCMLTKEIRVIVTPDIGLDAMPDTLICEMGELEITATVTRDFPIEWYSDRALTDNIGTGTAITVMPTDARTTYYAAVTDDNDCTQIDSTTVIVFNKDVGLEDTLITVCFGEMKALNPNGKPEYEYQWSPADGLDDAYFSQPDLQRHDGSDLHGNGDGCRWTVHADQGDPGDRDAGHRTGCDA
jgi:hypothetical protein